MKGVLHAWDHPGLDDVPSDLPVCWSTVSERAPGRGSVVTANLAPRDLAGKGTPATSTAQSQQGGTANASRGGDEEGITDCQQAV